jgi:DNA-binding SARP family transcriptional activator
VDEVQLLLLGPLEVWHDGLRVDIPGGRQRVMLALLLLAGPHAVAVKTLIDNLWPSNPPATAREQVRNAVARLRTALPAGGPAPQRDGAGYRLHPAPGNVDAHEFAAFVAARRFGEAAGLWRGPALSGLDSPLLRAEALRLDEQRLTALTEHARERLDAGADAGSLVAELTALHAAHPLRERVVGLLTLAQYRTGRRTEALETVRAYRRRLADEHGLDPGTQLSTLEVRMLRDDPVLNASSTALASNPTATAAAGPATADAAPRPAELPPDVAGFTGRDAELRELDQWAGAATVAAITGADGIGKTALVVHWGHRAADRFPDGQLYLDLRGYDETPPVPPLRALVRLLRSLDVRADRVPPGLDDAARLYRSVLAGRRVLVVLDNARSAEQVRPLLARHGRLCGARHQPRSAHVVGCPGRRPAGDARRARRRSSRPTARLGTGGAAPVRPPRPGRRARLHRRRHGRTFGLARSSAGPARGRAPGRAERRGPVPPARPGAGARQRAPRAGRPGRVGRPTTAALLVPLLGRRRGPTAPTRQGAPSLPGDEFGHAADLPDPAAARAWTAAELANLVAAVHQAADLDLAPITWLLADTLRGYLQTSRFLPEWRTVTDAALRVARNNDAADGEAAALLGER